MKPADTNAILNRILVLHHRSLPMYLGYAQPWFHGSDEEAKRVLHQIIVDQQQIVERLSEMILGAGLPVDYGDFPLRYSAFHDLSFDFLRKRLVEHQQQMIRQIEEYVSELQLAPVAQAVAQEALGEAKGQLESLQELGARTPATKRN